MYAGNATIITWLMRFPILVPAVVTVGIVTLVEQPPPDPPIVPPPATIAVPEPITVVPHITPRPVEILCPPIEELTRKALAKLPQAERNRLRAQGCVKG